MFGGFRCIHGGFGLAGITTGGHNATKGRGKLGRVVIRRNRNCGQRTLGRVIASGQGKGPTPICADRGLSQKNIAFPAWITVNFNAGVGLSRTVENASGQPFDDGTEHIAIAAAGDVDAQTAIGGNLIHAHSIAQGVGAIDIDAIVQITQKDVAGQHRIC